MLLCADQATTELSSTPYDGRGVVTQSSPHDLSIRTAGGGRVGETESQSADSTVRRHICVLSCQITLNAAVEPEQLREVMMQFHRSTSARLRAAQGFVAQRLPDGILLGEQTHNCKIFIRAEIRV